MDMNNFFNQFQFSFKKVFLLFNLTLLRMELIFLKITFFFNQFPLLEIAERMQFKYKFSEY